MKIFNALLAQESLADPIRQVQDVVQKCFDIEDLQSEVHPSCAVCMFVCTYIVHVTAYKWQDMVHGS